jgi:hypothetical protein
MTAADWRVYQPRRVTIIGLWLLDNGSGGLCAGEVSNDEISQISEYGRNRLLIQSTNN